MKKSHFILMFLHKIFEHFTYIPQRSDIIEDPDIISDMIYNAINSKSPFMISRFGAVEISALMNYTGVINNKHDAWGYITGKKPQWWWNEGIRFCMQNNAGFFPATDEMLLKFGELMMKDIKEINLLASWQKNEIYFSKQLINARYFKFIYLDPFWAKRPWTRGLKGKKVLVVHPFEQEIRDQYLNREKLHKNPDILPDFKLLTIKAVQSIGGNTQYKNWFEALEYMKNEIDKIDYDICLIGCGAYGLPLAAHVKRKGKIAIHFGGSLQLLFGIKGKRWETTKYGNGRYPELINEYWIRPYSNSKFKGANNVEGGCYW